MFGWLGIGVTFGFHILLHRLQRPLTLKDSNENIIQKLANNQHTILRSLDDLKNEISESKAEIEKQAKVNRNIGFATLALLVLLVILHFIA